MTRELVWKEVRDQGSVLAALLAMGCGLLAATAILTESSDAGRANELRSLVVASRLALVMLAMTAGVVVGGTLFAGEREAGTFAYLDRLPGSRWAVWWRKVATGGLMVLFAAGVFLGAGIPLGALGSGSAVPGWVALVLVITAIGYGWGVYGSVVSQTSLSACATGLMTGAGTGVLVYTGTGLVHAVVRTLFGVRLNVTGGMWETMSAVTVYSLLAVPIPLAGWVFTAADRQRFPSADAGPVRDVRGAVRAGLRAIDPTRWSFALGRLVWLVRRQAAVPAVVLAGVAVVAGGALIPETLSAVLVWPFASGVIGVLVAVAVMADEQGSDAARFWGERRIPLWRFWGAKLLASAGLTLVALVLLLVPSLVALAAGKGAQGPLVPSVFRSTLPQDMGVRTLLYLLVWPVYGVVFGHLSAIVFRKAIVAVAVGAMSAGIFASLWLPSLLAGGVHTWQVFGPALVALVAARAILWPWATDRLGSRSALTRLGAGLATSLAVGAAGIGYRVAEVPLIAEVDDDLEFTAALPTYDDQQSGRDVRRAVSQYNDVEARVREARVEVPFVRTDQQRPRYVDQVLEALAARWPDDRPDLNEWVDGVHTRGWPDTLATAARKPLGVVVDPNELHVRSVLPQLNDVRYLGAAYLAGGLRQQDQGDPAAFVDRLETWLYAARCLRNDTIPVAVTASWWCERDALNALDRWLERLAGHPELLRRALVAVQAHDRADPFDVRAARLAQQTIARNAVNAPGQWLPRYLQETKPGGLRPDALGQVDDASQAEASVIGVLWAFPWERERLRRVIGLGNVAGGTADQAAYLRGAPGWDTIAAERTLWPADGLAAGQSDMLAHRRAAVLKVALRLYQHDTGGLPNRLVALAPEYVPEVPADPFDKAPFRYRVSTGELLEMNRRRADPFAGTPPGFRPPALTYAEFHAVAGLAGGGVCWPLAPAWWDQTDDPSSTPPSLGVTAPPNPQDREVVTVPRGEGILWSVGPDHRDDGGTRLSLPGTARTRGHTPEDLIFIVPAPPTGRAARD